MSAIRVFVVDDSAFARKVFREALTAAPGIEVVGTARDGLEALEEIPRLEPDVISLDLMMPNLDGVGLLEELPLSLRRRAVVVSVSEKESEPAVRALQLGAFDVVTKPTAMATDQLLGVSEQLVLAIRRCAEAAALRESGPAPFVPASPPRHVSEAVELVVIGASTGGPAAITRLVPELPADFPAPVVVALHIPAGYTAAFAARLDEISPLHVTEMADGDLLLPGTVRVAPGGSHVVLERDRDSLRGRVRKPPEDAPFAPSVDLLFTSAADAVGSALLAAVLTGMGDDGLVGARAVSERHGRIVAESWSSAVVYGMPRTVVDAGLTSAVVPIDRMAATLVALAQRHT